MEIGLPSPSSGSTGGCHRPATRPTSPDSWVYSIGSPPQRPTLNCPASLPFADAHRNLGGHWTRLADEPLPGLDEWSRRHLGHLAALDVVTAAATVGTNLVHVDTRTDNVLLAESGPPDDVLVDWPGASLGAPWIDLVALLPALHLDGGPPPSDIFATHPLGLRADPLAVDAFLASLAGYFTRQSFLPPPPGLPTLRHFPAAQGTIPRRWLAQRLSLQ